MEKKQKNKGLLRKLAPRGRAGGVVIQTYHLFSNIRPRDINLSNIFRHKISFLEEIYFCSLDNPQISYNNKH